jgi:hypothetical protein
MERRRVDLDQAAHDYYVRHLIDRKQFLAVRDKLDREPAEEHKELLPLPLRSGRTLPPRADRDLLVGPGFFATHLRQALIWNWPDVERWAKVTGRLPKRAGS